MLTGVLTRYREFLPITEDTPIFTLGEGDTPLVRSKNLWKQIGHSELYFKLEGCNPTGSFKDRGMVMAVAKALEEKSSTIVCASTGNTSASAAAYGAYCGLKTIVLVPKIGVATGKLTQALAYGARVLAIDGNFDQALKLVRSLGEVQPVTLVNSINPNRLQGQKTAAFEIVDNLGDAPDYLFIPVGNAGNITAYWMGFREYEKIGRAAHSPHMMGFQAEGAAPIVRGEIVASPETVASALRIGNPASWKGALAARNESGGVIDAVSDKEIMEAYKLLAQFEGIFCEPASAASLAGLLKLSRQGMPFEDKRIVCVITGTGLKDPEIATRSFDLPIQGLPSDLSAIEKAVANA